MAVHLFSNHSLSSVAFLHLAAAASFATSKVMLIITDKLTIGQITFMLRVAIQILSYTGIFLISRLLLSSAPRTASLSTHDIVNRIASNSSLSLISVKWILSSLRFRNRNPFRPHYLLICVALLTIYGPFARLSDVGLLGFSSCSVPGRPFTDHPSSIATDDQALKAIVATMVPGTEPATTNAFRCDSVEVLRIDENVTLRNCTAWHNSTYADSTLFSGINMTDSDALTPLQLRRLTNDRSPFYLNSYYVGPGSKRIETSTIRNGILVDPHENGFRAIFGVPELTREHKAALPKTMALEVDVGCMELGIYSSTNRDNGSVFDTFATNGTMWRRYSGPDSIRGILSQTVDQVREYFIPLFNQSSIDQYGFLSSFNETRSAIAKADLVQVLYLPWMENDTDITASNNIFGNCTYALNQQHMIPPPEGKQFPVLPVFSCGMLGISGERMLEGGLYGLLTRMVCATTTQVNMVSTTVQMDAQGNVTLEWTYLPSDLIYVNADYVDVLYNVSAFDNATVYAGYAPIERYVLQDNPSSPIRHYIKPQADYSSIRIQGPGSGGSVFGSVGTGILMPQDLQPINDLALNVLGHDEALPLNASTVTRWAGQVGASYILGSIAYNGWTARSSEPIIITSTGGKPAICYKPLYAISFFPLLATAIVVIAWSMTMCLTKRLAGTKQLERLYGGMNPFAQVVCPSNDSEEMLLIWQGPESHLKVISASEASKIGGRGTALSYIKSDPRAQ